MTRTKEIGGLVFCRAVGNAVCWLYLPLPYAVIYEADHWPQRGKTGHCDLTGDRPLGSHSDLTGDRPL